MRRWLRRLNPRTRPYSRSAIWDAPQHATRYAPDAREWTLGPSQTVHADRVLAGVILRVAAGQRIRAIGVSIVGNNTPERAICSGSRSQARRCVERSHNPSPTRRCGIPAGVSQRASLTPERRFASIRRLKGIERYCEWSRVARELASDAALRDVVPFKSLEGSRVTTGSAGSSSVVALPNAVVCEICGTRLRVNTEPDRLEIGADARLSVARHRCIPRITTSTP